MTARQITIGWRAATIHSGTLGSVVEPLRRYGAHRSGCTVRVEAGDWAGEVTRERVCSCGLSQAVEGTAR